jgi:hypothetical protein
LFLPETVLADGGVGFFGPTAFRLSIKTNNQNNQNNQNNCNHIK